MKLYLIRHGQTMWNVDGRIQGKTDIPLNDTGLCQADLLSAAMEERVVENGPVTAVFSSPLKRAEQTATIVAARISLPVISVKELKEVDFGLWEGLTWDMIHRRYQEDFAVWDRNPTEGTPTGGEDREGCKARCRKGMEYILDHSRGDIMIVAHGGILVFVVDYLLRAQTQKNEIIVRNASITTVEYDRETGIGELLYLNDISHLAAVPEGRTNRYC